jgi:hypothetical protein
MSPRQLLFLGAVGLLSLAAAVFTGPMLLDALLGASEPADAAAPPPEAAGRGPHPTAQP